MTLKVGKISNVTYTKPDGETSRAIIPTSIPKVIRAIDVTELDEAERQEMEELYSEYVEYYQNAQKSLFNFETWVQHTKNRDVSVKWRSFKPDKLKEDNS